MESLVAFQKIAARYQRGGKAFDLALEKWAGMRESLENAFTPPSDSLYCSVFSRHVSVSWIRSFLSKEGLS